MKLAKLVLKRFEELETTAQEVDASRHKIHNDEWVDHDQFYKWSTSVQYCGHFLRFRPILGLAIFLSH